MIGDPVLGKIIGADSFAAIPGPNQGLACLGTLARVQGVAVAGLALVSSLLVFFLVSALTRGSADAIDPDIRLVMSV